MTTFRRREMAVEVAYLLHRITGDHCHVRTFYSENDNVTWRVVRTDWSGKEFDV